MQRTEFDIARPLVEDIDRLQAAIDRLPSVKPDELSPQDFLATLTSLREWNFLDYTSEVVTQELKSKFANLIMTMRQDLTDTLATAEAAFSGI